MSVLSVIMTVERLDTRKLQKTIMASTVVRQAVIDRAREVQAYWKANEAPVSTRDAHPLQKGGVEWDHPGDYQKSIKIRFNTNRVPFSAVVFTRDPKAHWLEYGSIHNPEFGFAGRVVEHFKGSGGGVTMGRSIRSSDRPD
jgi:hypothetical protein